MPSLSEAIAVAERLEQATATAREVISEMNSATKAMRKAEREVDQKIKSVPRLVDQAVNNKIKPFVEEELAELTKGVHKLYGTINHNFDRLTEPMFGTLGLLKQATEARERIKRYVETHPSI